MEDKITPPDLDRLARFASYYAELTKYYYENTYHITETNREKIREEQARLRDWINKATELASYPLGLE